MAAAIVVPFGIKVPSENLKSFNALRERDTNELSSQDDSVSHRNQRKIVRTATDAFNALALLEEAIDFSHLAQ